MPTAAERAAKIEGADIIAVSGGNTLFAVTPWLGRIVTLPCRLTLHQIH